MEMIISSWDSQTCFRIHFFRNKLILYLFRLLIWFFCFDTRFLLSIFVDFFSLLDALNDLNRAVELSAGRANNVESNALCQRALLHRLEGREQDAFDDFERAAKLGHQFAKAQLVKLNPYAALCNQMLGEMIATLQAPCATKEEK